MESQMDAAGIIQTIISLGGTIKDLVTKNTENGTVDWTAVIKAGSTDPTIKDDVSKMLADLKASNFDAAIQEIDKKQQAILKGRTLPQLSNAEMLQFDDLADARLVLATNQLKAALDQNVGQWLVNTALPALADIAPTVLALLL
jgi:hypothetical protein